LIIARYANILTYLLTRIRLLACSDFVDRVSGESNAVGRVRPSVRLLLRQLLNQLTFDLNTFHAHCRDHSQWRRKQFESGGHMASAEREPIRGSRGGTPSGVQRHSPWSGGRSPPEAERFLGIIRRKDTQYLPLYPAFESAEISPNIA